MLPRRLHPPPSPFFMERSINSSHSIHASLSGERGDSQQEPEETTQEKERLVALPPAIGKYVDGILRIGRKIRFHTSLPAKNKNESDPPPKKPPTIVLYMHRCILRCPPPPAPTYLSTYLSGYVSQPDIPRLSPSRGASLVFEHASRQRIETCPQYIRMLYFEASILSARTHTRPHVHTHSHRALPCALTQPRKCLLPTLS